MISGLVFGRSSVFLFLILMSQNDWIFNSAAAETP